MDLLGRRWSLRVLWELREGRLGARALLGRCAGLSSSVLYDRLRELSSAGLVERGLDESYVLTDLGASLGAALQPLDAWSRSWARRYHPDGSDPPDPGGLSGRQEAPR